jgi:hypothetical protein
MLPSERLAAVASLWVTDAELIRRLGVPEKIARQVIRAFDANPKLGFPQKSKLWGNRRYWPAVRGYLDHTSGFNMISPQREKRHATEA